MPTTSIDTVTTEELTERALEILSWEGYGRSHEFADLDRMDESQLFTGTEYQELFLADGSSVGRWLTPEGDTTTRSSGDGLLTPWRQYLPEDWAQPTIMCRRDHRELQAQLFMPVWVGPEAPLLWAQQVLAFNGELDYMRFYLANADCNADMTATVLFTYGSAGATAGSIEGLMSAPCGRYSFDSIITFLADYGASEQAMREAFMATDCTIRDALALLVTEGPHLGVDWHDVNPMNPSIDNT
jgi:hypothetical protein